MAKLGVSPAARLAGVTRATMYKHINSGKLSADRLPDGSGYAIDTSELIRVYGSLHTLDSLETPETPPDTEALQRENEHLRDQLKAKDELLQEKAARIADLQTMVRNLEYRQPSHQDQTPQTPRRGFWSRLFGGDA